MGKPTTSGVSGLCNLFHEFGARHGHLLALREMLERERVRLHFILPDDQDVAGFDLVRRLERFFQAESFVSQLDDQIFVAAQLPRQAGGLAIHSRAERRDVNIWSAENFLRRFS